MNKGAVDERNKHIRGLARRGLSCAEIGRQMGLSRSRVSQILKASPPENKEPAFPKITLFPLRFGVLDWVFVVLWLAALVMLAWVLIK